MQKAELTFGSTCYLRRPTKAVRNKHEIDVVRIKETKKKPTMTAEQVLINKLLETLSVGPRALLADRTLICGIPIPDEYFNTTVLFVGPEDRPWIINKTRKAGVTKSGKRLELSRVIILDKERVKHKHTIEHLVHKEITVPTVILRPKGRIIDLRKMPPTVPTSAYEKIRHADTGSRTDHLLRKHDITAHAAEQVANGRKYITTGATSKEHIKRNLIDTDILTRMSSPSKMTLRNNNTRVSLQSMTRVEQYMVCSLCYHYVAKQTLVSSISTQPRKKGAGKGHHTYRCDNCLSAFALHLEDSRVIFKCVEKGQERETLLTLEEASNLNPTTEIERKLRLKAKQILGILTAEETGVFTELFGPQAFGEEEDDEENWDDEEEWDG